MERIVVQLSGGDVVGVEGMPAGAELEVRQYHADFNGGPDEPLAEDDVGRYAVAASVLGGPEGGLAPVTAGPAPRPVEHRGVRAWATVEDYSDDPDRYVTVRYFLDPPPPGLDVEVYSHNAVKVPEGHRRG